MTLEERTEILKLIGEGKTVRETAGLTKFPMDWIILVVQVSDLPRKIIDTALKNFYTK